MAETCVLGAVLPSEQSTGSPAETKTMMFKKLLAMVVVAVACMTIAFAQSGSAHKIETKTVHSKMAAKSMYVCEMCNMASMKAGKCPHCGMKMSAMKGKMVYKCPMDGSMSTKAGKCPKCKMAMKPMMEAYVCDHCHTSSDKAGKCEKCGQKMMKKTIPMPPSKM